MKVSFAITVHNEGIEFKQLMDAFDVYIPLLNYDYEIVIVDDNSTDPLLTSTLFAIKNNPKVHIYKHALNGNFAEHKNFLVSKCTGDYIFNIDADELPPKFLVQHFTTFIAQNPSADVFRVPRINVVDGITERHVKMWGWNITSIPSLTTERLIDTESQEFDFLYKYDLVVKQALDARVVKMLYKMPIINFPDYQMRIWKNKPEIRWVGLVHEQLMGQGTVGDIPPALEVSLLHKKSIQKQEWQNAFYHHIIHGK